MPDQEASLLIRFRDETLSSGGTSKGFSARKDDGGASGTAGAQVAEDFQRSLGEGIGRKPPYANYPRKWALGEHPGDWNLGDNPQPVPPDGARSMPSDGAAEVPGAASGLSQAAARAAEQSAVGKFATANQPATVAQVAGLAGQAGQALGGPVGQAIARTAQAVAAVPGVGAMQVPGLAAAALPAATAVAIPAAIIAGGVAVGAAVTGYGIAAARSAREEIRGLSPELAQAEAEARYRQTMANLRTAGILGPDVAEYVRNQSVIRSNLQNLRDITAQPIIKEINEFGEAAAKVTTLFSELATKLRPLIQTAEDLAIGGAVGGNLGIIVHLLNKFLPDIAKADPNNPFTYFTNHPLVPLPPPFTGAEEKPVNAAFAPVAGMTF